jgi:hypothetical protein
MEAVLGFPLVPVFFPGQSRFTMCPDVTRNSVWEARCPGVFQVIKYDISDNVYEYFDFGTVRDNVYRSRTGISQLLTGRNMRGETGSCVNVKVKFTLEQAMKAQRGSRGIALLFL